MINDRIKKYPELKHNRSSYDEGAYFLNIQRSMYYNIILTSQLNRTLERAAGLSKTYICNNLIE